MNVISIQEGQGVVQDEMVRMRYRITLINSLWGLLEITETNQLHERWRSLLRNGKFMILFQRFYAAVWNVSRLLKKKIRESPKLDFIGRNLAEVLWNWHKNSPESFRNVSDSLAYSTNLEIDHCLVDGQNQLVYWKDTKIRFHCMVHLMAHYV